MKSKMFSVSGKWNLKEQSLPFFVKEIQVDYDAKGYQLKLTPFHSTVFDHIRKNLNGISLTAESDTPFFVEIKKNVICLHITNGKLGHALQALIDNRHINLQTGEAILGYHHQLHKPTYIQRCTSLCSSYEPIPDQAPAPSFKLEVRF